MVVSVSHPHSLHPNTDTFGAADWWQYTLGGSRAGAAQGKRQTVGANQWLSLKLLVATDCLTAESAQSFG